ncbi:hypothetical protein AB432_030180 [Brevibacillus brevis]|uniref:Uncharacterized protein n=1 Tax=Brevibacillus brevis TaxID=1393 RepID=A0A2Z4MR89_BREBE|nr:hypothetical protein [Brevibacillus brevis]AWX59056.1 hypothetical protein AB432_030180 [Brevibacillus brevis]
MVSFERVKASVGLSNFVEYYEDYRKYFDQPSASNKEQLAQKLLVSNLQASSIGAQITRINSTTIIFSNKWEKEILMAAINSSHPSVKEAIKSKARELLKSL